MSLYRTEQEVFDYVLTRIREQGQSNNSCAYRAKNGTRCSVGWMILDSMYNHRMEGIPVHNLLSRFPGAIPEEYLGENDSNLSLIFQLQRAHDRSHGSSFFSGVPFMSAFEKNMRRVADEHGLTYTPPKGE